VERETREIGNREGRTVKCSSTSPSLPPSVYLLISYWFVRSFIYLFIVYHISLLPPGGGIISLPQCRVGRKKVSPNSTVARNSFAKRAWRRRRRKKNTPLVRRTPFSAFCYPNPICVFLRFILSSCLFPFFLSFPFRSKFIQASKHLNASNSPAWCSSGCLIAWLRKLRKYSFSPRSFSYFHLNVHCIDAW